MARSNIMPNLTISMPFTFKSDYSKLNPAVRVPGPVASTTELKQIYKQRIFLVLMTRYGERVMRPDFGSNLHLVVFENENVALEIANLAIKTSFSKWLPDLNLLEISPKYDKINGAFEFTIVYSLPSGESDSTTINTALFNRTGNIIQEMYRSV